MLIINSYQKKKHFFRFPFWILKHHTYTYIVYCRRPWYDNRNSKWHGIANYFDVEHVRFESCCYCCFNRLVALVWVLSVKINTHMCAQNGRTCFLFISTTFTRIVFFLTKLHTAGTSLQHTALKSDLIKSMHNCFLTFDAYTQFLKIWFIYHFSHSSHTRTASIFQ